MSIDRLRYFAAVVQTKNLRKAAELVGISPPSMSKAISVLETELQTQLIFPDGRGIDITPKGLEIYIFSASLLEEYQRFFDRLGGNVTNSDQIRIATFEVFSSYFISSFISSNKLLDFLVLEKAPGRIEDAIIAGLVDVGITYIPAPNHALEFREIGTFKMGIFGRKDWENEEFQKWPFAVPTTEMRIHSSDIDSLDMWPKNAPPRTVRYRFELLETALQTSRHGLSVLHCPEFIVHLQNAQIKPSLQLTLLGPPLGYRLQKPKKVYLVGRKSVLSSELERKLAKFMRTFK